MFWDKKENTKGLPDLPPMKFSPPVTPVQNAESDDDDSDSEESAQGKHGLPSFPDSPMQRGFSQSAIKDAVTHESTGEESVGQPIGSMSNSIKTVEVEEWSPQQSFASTQPFPPPPSMPVMREMPMVSRQPVTEMRPIVPVPVPAPTFMPVNSASSRATKNNDIFVKIEKFYSAKKALEATNNKLDEIDSVLHKIREIKMREEQELAAWEKDLATVKTRIKEVTDTIFEKVE